MRADAPPATLDVVRSVLRATFPEKRMTCIEAPVDRPAQTTPFGKVDLVTLPKRGRLGQALTAPAPSRRGRP